MLSSIGKNIEGFRQNYPVGENFVVAYDIDKSFKRRYGVRPWLILSILKN